MTRITHVLCPVDFSEISQHAVDHASAIAGWYNARLTLLFVFANIPSMDLPPLVLEDADRALLMTDMRKMTALVPPRVVLDFGVHEAGYVHDEIVAQVDETQADLLVLGTHGRSGFQRLFLGSVTEKVIRKATCPTLVVPPRAADVAPDAPVQFRRILCPIDFSESSVAALAQAIDLAEQADARLTVLHVVELPPVLSPEPIVLERMGTTTVADARNRLHDLIPQQARARSTVETLVVEGRAYPEILRHAAEQRSDLVVMGVHGRGVIDRLIFGSTTHHVIRAAACPVLIVRGG
jgi:nucleotide-binding universal stress UspA family protein